MRARGVTCSLLLSPRCSVVNRGGGEVAVEELDE